jgi:membrane fusion protein, multidrug efflux system
MDGLCVVRHCWRDWHASCPGVPDKERVDLPKSVPYVERFLNWVRAAQRFPVRIRLKVPPTLLAWLGASALAEVMHGAACR